MPKGRPEAKDLWIRSVGSRARAHDCALDRQPGREGRGRRRSRPEFESPFANFSARFFRTSTRNSSVEEGSNLDLKTFSEADERANRWRFPAVEEIGDVAATDAREVGELVRRPALATHQGLEASGEALVNNIDLCA